MKLRIANLGVIKEATFDLSKKLTVFCGPNGTGKTWAAYVINGFIDRDQIFHLRPLDINFKILSITGVNTFNITTKELHDIFKEEVGIMSNFLSFILPVPVEKFKDLFDSFQLTVQEEYEQFSDRFKKTRISSSVQLGLSTINVSKPEDSLEITLKSNHVIPESYRNDDAYRIWFEGAVARALIFYPITTSTALPVERNAVFTFNKELSLQKIAAFERAKNIVKNSDQIKELEKFLIGRTTRYAQPVRDALDVADDITNISHKASPFYEFGVEVEQHLLQGRVGIDSGGEVNFTPSKADGKSFSFQLSSSAVKTLSSLIVYLKYQAQPNDLLIIDEPELNLHPDNQILLARVFARMINKGMRLLISTHSDYIIRELNNMIMLSANEPAMKKVAKEFGYHSDEKINYEDIGVYLFHFKNKIDKHVTVEEVEVAKNGFEIKTIEDTIKLLNERSEEIYYTMKYGEQVR